MFLLSTIGTNGFSMVFQSVNHWQRWFSIVANDAMVTIHRSGLVLSFLLISYSWSSCLRSREDISPCCCMCIVSLKSSPPKFPPVWVQLILMDWQHYEMGSAVCCLQLPRSRGTTLILSWIKHKSHLALKVGDSSRNYADPFLNQQKRIKTTLEGCQLFALQGTCPK